MGTKQSSRDYDSQEIDNLEHDPDLHLRKTMNYESDGTSGLAQTSGLVAKKITVSGANTYVALAPIGTAQATAGWQVKKINVTGGDTVITWAQGAAGFTETATDLTAAGHNYS